MSSAAVHAAGVVGTGTAGSCNETTLGLALVGGGSVTFDCGGPATIVMSVTKVITSPTTITGTQGIILSGGSSTQIFRVIGTSLTLERLTLVDGRDSMSLGGGAAIRGESGPAQTSITIRESTLEGNETDFGGCPAVDARNGTVTVERSTVTGNVNRAADLGSAICGANFTVRSSTIAGNVGGGIWGLTNGAVVNSTVASNTLSGILPSAGVVVLSGGVSAVQYRNSILAGNAGTGQCGDSPGGVFGPGVHIDLGGNLQFPGNACGPTIPTIDPALAALADNGGPTRTMAITSPSAAIDAGTPGNCALVTTDQRGQPATDGDGDGSVVCDSGAFEADASSVLAIPSLGGAGLAALATALACLGVWRTSLRRR